MNSNELFEPDELASIDLMNAGVERQLEVIGLEANQARLFGIFQDLLDLYCVCQYQERFGVAATNQLLTPQQQKQFQQAVTELKTLVACEGWLSEAIINTTVYVAKEIKLIVMAIIQGIIDFFKAIFTRKAKIIRTAVWYQEHFKKHPINDGRFRTAVASMPISTELIDRVMALYKVGFVITPIMQQFQATGSLLWNDVEQRGLTRQLAEAGFAISQTAQGELQIEGMQSNEITTTPSSYTVGQAGWSALSVTEALTHVIGLNESLNRLQEIKSQLKPVLFSGIDAKVVSEETRDQYAAGAKAIDRLLLLYGNQSIAVSESTLHVAEIAKHYCE